MSSPETTSKTIRLSVQNIGGISETDVTFTPGVTVLEGRNATNRTSLLQAIMAACGSDVISIKGDADSATVELTIDGESYERNLSRESGNVVASGDSLLDDPTLANLFAFLLESNEARQAVARGDDLRELIMRPVDTSAIKAEIEQLEARKRQIDDQLERIDERKRELPELEEERTRLTDEIEQKESEIEEIEAEIDAVEGDVDEQQQEQQAVEGKLAELRDKRSRLDDVRYDVETEKESLDSLKAERDELESSLEDLPESAETDEQDLKSDISTLRTEKRRLEGKITELNTVIQFNKEMLGGENEQVRTALDQKNETESDGPLTDKLLEDDEKVTCWTCGSSVQSSAIEDTIDLLQELRANTTDERDAVTSEIDELQERVAAIEERRRTREQYQRQLERVADDIEERNDAIESLREQRETLESDIENLEAEIEELRNDHRSELLDLHEQANDLEYELGRLQSKRESIDEQIEEIEAHVADEDDLQAEREEIQEELSDLRTRIDRIQADAVDQFNEHMETVLDLLEYDNLDRVWIERTETQIREGRRKSTKPVFDLHVIRQSDGGTAYEDTVDHLSESEREVVGLVFALAGYLVHDVHEECPFILLDSLEALDSGRIARLIEYLEEYGESLVVALLPEDAQALDSSYQRISNI